MKPYIIVARKSPLSQLQVAEFKSLFSSTPLQFEEKWMDTSGDLNKSKNLMDSDLPDNFFTCKLDQSLLNGEVDIAIHSAKDLPEFLDKGLTVVAILPCLDHRDSLLSIQSKKLTELPPQAVIGTSSLTRESEIKKIRQDLIFKPIRGTIEERIEKMHQGLYDAIIIAHCALIRLNLEHHLTEILPIQTTPLQGNLAVVIRSDRYDLFSLLHHFDERKKWGQVHFIGFGPGDPELLTIKGDRLIRQADTILYDDLIDPSYLKSFLSSHQLHYVGKRGGKALSTAQSDIHHLMYKEVLKNKKVVRLKGGDPSLFARLGEEISFLRKARIHYNIIPGVTSTTAGAAQLKVSLTQRYQSHSLSILTAHHAQTRSISVPQTDTIAYLMGANELKSLSKRLIEQGRSPETPVLLIQSISYNQEVSFVTTIEKMGDASLSSPLLILVGKAFSPYVPVKKMLYLGLNPPLHWGDFNIIHHPLIQIKSKNFSKNINFNHYEGLILTSQTAVKFFSKNYDLSKIKIASIGDKTSQMIRQKGGEVFCQPSIWNSEYLYKTLEPFLGTHKKWLYPCSGLSSNCLNKSPFIEDFPIYQTELMAPSPLKLSHYEGLFFTSPSTVQAFYQLYNQHPLASQTIVVQGDRTQECLQKRGFPIERMILRYEKKI